MIRRHRHDSLPTFGVGSEFDAAEWRSIFRQIQAARLIEQETDDERWCVTEVGRAVLTGETPIELVAISGRNAATSARRTSSPRSHEAENGDASLSAADERLFAALKAKRLALAREHKLPAYVICTDRSLRAIAHARPKDAVTLSHLYGLGPAKVKAYGADILAIVAEHAV